MSQDENLIIRPELYDNNSIQFNGLVVPLENIGCRTQAEDLIRRWNQLESEGFPLRSISSLFYILDRNLLQIPEEDLPKVIGFHIPGHLRHLINVVDLIDRILPIKGGSKRVSSLKEELSALNKEAAEINARQNTIAQEISKKILAAYDEFLVGFLLHEANPSAVFNEGSGPDFYIASGDIHIESKSKLNRSFAGYSIDLNDLDKKKIKLDRDTCLKLLSKDVFEAGRIEEAFDKQDTDIAILNTTHSQFGTLFAAHAKLTDDTEFRFENVIGSSIQNNPYKTIILFCEAVSGDAPFATYALAARKETIEYFGSRLDKIQKDSKIDTSTTEGFEQLIAEAKNLKTV
jgi:hypothetical protein